MWNKQDDKLYCRLKFDDFKESIEFINKVADLAEQKNHHPTIRNTYNVVELWLTTHDQGDAVTQKDIDLAAEIEHLLD